MKPDEGTGGLEENGKDPEQGGGKAAGVRIFLPKYCPYGLALGNGDVGSNPPYGTVSWGFPRLGGTETYEAASRV